MPSPLAGANAGAGGGRDYAGATLKKKGRQDSIMLTHQQANTKQASRATTLRAYWGVLWGALLRVAVVGSHVVLYLLIERLPAEAATAEAEPVQLFFAEFDVERTTLARDVEQP